MNRTEFFIDGNFFYQASNFFRYQHQENKRLNLEGIIELARTHLSERGNPAVITRTRIYRGRHTEPSTGETLFDDFAIRMGIELNHFPMQNGEEKEVDVALALDAYEAAKDHYCENIVLFAGDTDFLPLIKHLHKMGVQTLVIGFNNPAEEGGTKTSYRLVREASGHIFLEDEVKDREKRKKILYETPYKPMGTEWPETGMAMETPTVIKTRRETTENPRRKGKPSQNQDQQ
jgi:uncharacterized LabA/DUF88 family protein